MKQLIFALSVCLLTVSCANQPAPKQQTATAAPPPTTVPAVSISAPPLVTPPPFAVAAGIRPNIAIVPALSPGFLARHQSFVPIAKKGDIDVLFMGDSITDFWRNDPSTMARGRRGPATNAATRAASTRPAVARAPALPPIPGAYIGKPVFDKYFGSWKVANFGIAGDTTQGVLWRLQNGEGQGYQPKAIMLMIGTNNLGRSTPTEIAMGDAAIIFEMRKDFPDAKILLLGVFPRGAANAPQRPQIAEINRMISTLNDGRHVFYLDIGAKFLADDGSIPREIMSDGLHPTTKGYEIWAQAVKGPLENMMK